MSAILDSFRFAKNLASFSAGYAAYKIKGITPKPAYSSMRQLYVQTNGKFNETVAKLETSLKKKYVIDHPEGILGKLGDEELNEIIGGIKTDGYFIFKNKLSREKIGELLDFSRTAPAIPRIVQDRSPAVYDSVNPKSPIYDFSSKTLFESPVLQPLLIDKSLLAVAQAYLGSAPVLDLVAMWWSTASAGQVDLSKAAQLYHFDMDRIKFLKFFIYLSDVDTYNGPHCYIRGSHKVKPKPVRRDGRILDEELVAQYPSEDFKEITGSIGTIIAVDTSGFHKGKPLEKGERLLFQMEFATSMFGQYYPPVEITDRMNEDFLRKTEQYKGVFAGILKR